MPFGPLSNGAGQKGGVPSHGGLTPSRGVPLTGFPSTPLTQPYAIPSRGGMHGPIGAVPQVPQAGSRGFGAGRGSTSGPIGGHLSHHQASQQQGALGGAFGFGGLDSPATQPSLGGPMTQQGILTQMQTQTLSQNLRDGFSLGGMSQDFFGEDFKSQGSHVGYTGQEFATQGAFGMDYNTQANHGGYGGDFITQNSQPGYSHQSGGSDFISQVISVFLVWWLFYYLNY
jgi:regulator of nonsense transcripts 1